MTVDDTPYPGDPNHRLLVEAYTDKLSYRAGEVVHLHLSARCTRYSIEVYRAGALPEVVLKLDDLSGTGLNFPVPDNAPTDGCNWPAVHEFEVPADWKSGCYIIVMKSLEPAAAPTGKGEAFFVVRSTHPGKNAKILLQLTTNTYNAYNIWGGTSYYIGWPTGRENYRLSFDRPLAPGFLSIDGYPELFGWNNNAGWHKWERVLVEWAERSGFSIDYAVNSDLENPDLLARRPGDPERPGYNLVLSVGHDEYWTKPMRDNLERFIEQGGNVAFLSGNTCYWQVRLSFHQRTMTCFRENYKHDPLYVDENTVVPELATAWSHYLINRPESLLTGVSFPYGGYHRWFIIHHGSYGYTVARGYVDDERAWPFAGVHFTDSTAELPIAMGDFFGALHRIVDYECDGCPIVLENGLPVATGHATPADFTILAWAPAALDPGTRSLLNRFMFKEGEGKQLPVMGAAVMGIYTKPGGGRVFTTGCTNWVFGLGGLNGGDPIVQAVTKNVLTTLQK